MATKSIDLKLDNKSDAMTKEYVPPKYPSFTIESSEDHDLPESGTCTISFNRRDSSHNEDENGKHRYRCTVEVEKMSNIKGGKADKADEGEAETPAEDAAEGGTEEEAPSPKKNKRSPAVAAALSGEGEY